jgi:RNA polymerase-binding transcription factor DksA
MATKSKKSPKSLKPAPKKAAAKKLAPKAKPAPKKVVAKKAAPKSKPVAKKAAQKASKPAKKVVGSPKATVKPPAAPAAKSSKNGSAPSVPVKLTGFLAKQRQRLLILKDTLLDSMNGVAKDSLRSRAEGSEASAFGMHQADAGSDAYDRDFALSLLSQEQDSLYEIDQALRRVDTGSYGICEISGKPIPHPRLEALPFTRYTVECQADIEKRNRFSSVRQPVTSLFGLGDDDGGDDDDDSPTDTKD